MTEPLVHLNGRMVPAHEARVPVYDQGLLYGYGLFETMRAYEGRVFRMSEHLDRLGKSAQELGLPVGGRLDELAHAVDETIAANGLTDARIRLTVTGGESVSGPVVPTPGEPTVLVTASAMPSAEDRSREFERGWCAVVASRTRHSRSVTAAHKTTSYLQNLVARAEASDVGADEALILNERGCLTEGAMTNVFVVRGGVLLTPATVFGLLPGITRNAVVELAEARVTVAHGMVPLGLAEQAEEIFVTNSLIEIMPVTELGGRAIGDGSPGEVTRALAQDYRRLVAEELGLNGKV